MSFSFYKYLGALQKNQSQMIVLVVMIITVNVKCINYLGS
jgi:hypothetical protein